MKPPAEDSNGSVGAPSPRVARALARAREAKLGSEAAPKAASRPRRKLVIGDPQASAHQFFSILERAGALSPSGWLSEEVRLTSMGDHFDYGDFEVREQAADSGQQILAWLAAHSPEQVTLLAGNHDLSRVAELFTLDDPTFQRAAERAHELYRERPVAASEERAFLRDYPMFASVEVVARDLSTFRVEQRELVTRLLRARRFRLATAEEGLLLVHAGATRADLARAGLDESEFTVPKTVADRLNQLFDDAVARWDGDGPFSVPGFFEPGSADKGESGGFLFQRAERPNGAADGRSGRRRFDPRTLPLGLAQVVGHVRDPKSRSLLGAWARDDAAPEGELRHLLTDGRDVWYRRGLPVAPPSPTEAQMIFTDGGMHHVPAERYRLLELPCY